MGQRFEIRSLRGSLYGCRLVQQTDAWLIVRLDDGRLARINPARFEWGTYEPRARGPVLVRGDAVEVQLAGSALEGALVEPVGAEVALRLPSGTLRRVPGHAVQRLSLVFRASDLQTGDTFRVLSRSGNRFRGDVLGIEPGGRTQVRLDHGSEVVLHQSRLDMNTLEVLVPVDVESEGESDA